MPAPSQIDQSEDGGRSVPQPKVAHNHSVPNSNKDDYDRIDFQSDVISFLIGSTYKDQSLRDFCQEKSLSYEDFRTRLSSYLDELKASL